mgnify:FL=1
MVANISQALSEPTPTTTAEAVASTEKLIEHCSLLHPTEVRNYESVREKMNSALPKKNYFTVLSSEAYKSARAFMEEQIKGRPTDELDVGCQWLKNWIRNPPDRLSVKD